VTSIDVTMRNTPATAEELNRLVDSTAPAVNTTIRSATKDTVTFTLSGSQSDVNAVYAAGERARMW
jgi:hypothetical protein